MTFNQRIIQHNHRGMVAARQLKETSTVSPRPTATRVIVPPHVTTRTTPARKPPVSATSVSSSSTSRPAIPTSASVSDSVSASTSSILSVPPFPLSIVTSTISTAAPAIPTPPNIPLSSLSAIASSSTSIVPNSTGGLSTGSLIGIIGGSIGAVVVTGLVVAFFLRRLRKQKSREGFDPTKFRRSAIMLDDKDEKAGFRPRPPTMIERRKAQATNSVMAGNLPTPSTAFPYSDQTPTSASQSLYDHGHPQSFAHRGASDTQSYGTVPPPGPPSGYSGIPGAYGIPPPLSPYNGAQHEQAGYGAPPIPGTYGPSAYAAYGPDPRYPQYQQRYPHFSSYHQTFQHAQPQQMSGYGNANTQPPSVSANLTLPNPFMSSRNVSSNASPQPPLPLTEKQRAATMVGASSSSSPSSLTRQPTQSSDAPPAYVDEDNSRWDISRKDVKSRPKELSVTNDVGEQATESSSGSATATPASMSPPNTPSHRTQPNPTGPRPTSVYTLYDQDDAYGGM